MALLCINRMNLPQDILTIIKEYTFISLERKTIMKNLSLIHTCLINDNNLSYQPYAFLFWKKNCKYNEFHYMEFCIRCGGYTYHGSMSASCKC